MVSGRALSLSRFNLSFSGLSEVTLQKMSHSLTGTTYRRWIIGATITALLSLNGIAAPCGPLLSTDDEIDVPGDVCRVQECGRGRGRAEPTGSFMQSNAGPHRPYPSWSLSYRGNRRTRCTRSSQMRRPPTMRLKHWSRSAKPRHPR